MTEPQIRYPRCRVDMDCFYCHGAGKVATTPNKPCPVCEGKKLLECGRDVPCVVHEAGAIRVQKEVREEREDREVFVLRD